MFKYSRWLLLILLCIFFAVCTTTFWSPTKWDNIFNIVLQQAPFLILLSLSMTLAIILNGIDLSIGAIVSLTSCIAAIVLQATHSIPLGILSGIALGVVLGGLNGILIAKVHVSPFIATYSVSWIARGFAYVFLGGKQIYDLGPGFRDLFVSSPYTLFLIAVVVSVVMWFLMTKSVFGTKVFSIGSNEFAAKLSGINVNFVLIVSYTLMGVLAALTGIMYIANLGCAEPVIGDDFALSAIAAALIGGTSFGGGEGKISNAIIGAFIMVILTNGMIHLGVPSFWQQFVVGTVIVLAMIMERGVKKFAHNV